MIIAAAILTAAISIDLDLPTLRPQARPDSVTATCNIKTVAYRFRGEAGQKFRYAGDPYAIPAEGVIELLASPRHTTYTLAGSTVAIDGPAADEFGIRDVQLRDALSRNGATAAQNEGAGK